MIDTTSYGKLRKVIRIEYAFRDFELNDFIIILSKFTQEYYDVNIGNHKLVCFKCLTKFGFKFFSTGQLIRLTSEVCN